MKADCIKWIKKKSLLMSCSFITSRANTDALYPRVINKVQIGPQFEYIILQCFQHTFSTALITRSNSSKVNKFNKQQQLIQVTAAERTRERDVAAQIARLISEWEQGRTYPLGKGRRLPWAPKSQGPPKMLFIYEMRIKRGQANGCGLMCLLPRQPSVSELNVLLVYPACSK